METSTVEFLKLLQFNDPHNFVPFSPSFSGRGFSLHGLEDKKLFRSSGTPLRDASSSFGRGFSLHGLEDDAKIIQVPGHRHVMPQVL